jgi:histidinol-phosphate aminotransferase
MEYVQGKDLRALLKTLTQQGKLLPVDLAAYVGHDVDGVWAANGSNEVQQQLLQAFGGPGRTALGFGPSYSMHPLLAKATSTAWVPALRGPDFGLTAEAAVAQVEAHRPDVVFLCSPNNPTGTALDPAVVTAVLEAAPGMVVVDEAYAEFARPGTPSALRLLPAYPRLVVTRTMSKAFGFAGGRLGYLAAGPAVVDAVQLVRLPYHLSALTQAAARAALAHRGALLVTVEAIMAQRDRIVTTLRAAGHSVADSDANFVLFAAGRDGRAGDQKALWSALLERGVLVRDVGLAGWLRVTAGTPQETDAFLSALHELDTPALEDL